MKKNLILAYVLFTISAFGQSSKKDSIHQTIPFEDIDMTWANGNDRRTESTFSELKYFVPSVMIDINYTYSFNHPNDNTVVGSTALTRNNEITLSALHFGGDINYKNARARFMTQFGTRSIVVPRNDVSPYKGQYQLAIAVGQAGEGGRTVSRCCAGLRRDGARRRKQCGCRS